MAGIFSFSGGECTTLAQCLLYFSSLSSHATFVANGGRQGTGFGAIGYASFSSVGVQPCNFKILNYAISNTVAVNIGFNYKANGSNVSTTTNPFLTLVTDHGTWSILQSISSSSGFQVLKQLGGSAFINGITPLMDGNWHWIEVSVVFSTTSSGSVNVYVDGTLNASYSGITITGTLPTQLQYLVFDMSVIGNNSQTVSSWLSDIVQWDASGSFANTFPIGPSYVNVETAVSNGSLSQYTPSSGANWQCVSGGLAGSSFVSDSGTGNIDLYNMANLPTNPNVVQFVQVDYYAENSGTGTANLIPKVKTGATTTSGSTQVLPTASLQVLYNIFQSDATGTGWTYSTVNSSQFGQGD